MHQEQRQGPWRPRRDPSPQEHCPLWSIGGEGVSSSYVASSGPTESVQTRPGEWLADLSPGRLCRLGHHTAEPTEAK